MSKARENVFLQIQVHKGDSPLNAHIIDKVMNLSDHSNPEHIST